MFLLLGFPLKENEQVMCLPHKRMEVTVPYTWVFLAWGAPNSLLCFGAEQKGKLSESRERTPSRICLRECWEAGQLRLASQGNGVWTSPCFPGQH